jgi:hypothetical protein
VSRTVWEWLSCGPNKAQVLATFENACNLITPSGEVIALVAPTVGNGPLNVVLDHPNPPLSSLVKDASVELTEHMITTAAFEVDLSSADVWNPCPNWELLRAHRDRVLSCLSELRDLCIKKGPPGSLVSILKPPAPTEAVDAFIVGKLRETMGVLDSGWTQSPISLREVARRLTGLGVGLTPSGDDFLIGMMLWAWLDHPDPLQFCQEVTTVCAQTTTLSDALLRATARGECSAAWHDLLKTICDQSDSGLETATRAVLAHGATSGADALAGLIWLGMLSAGAA